MVKWVTAAAMLAAVYATNWMLETFGMVPVGFGLEAPAGVYLAGLVFGLRDVLHETGGPRWVVGAIVCGAALSYVLSDGATIPGGVVSIAVASAAAFLLSEFADFAVYTPLRERHWPIAAAVSNVAGAVVDSAVFLWLAFGSLEFIAGQVVGKAYMVAVALPLVWLSRRNAR